VKRLQGEKAALIQSVTVCKSRLEQTEEHVARLEATLEDMKREHQQELARALSKGQEGRGDLEKELNDLRGRVRSHEHSERMFSKERTELQLKLERVTSELEKERLRNARLEADLTKYHETRDTLRSSSSIPSPTWNLKESPVLLGQVQRLTSLNEELASKLEEVSVELANQRRRAAEEIGKQSDITYWKSRCQGLEQERDELERRVADLTERLSTLQNTLLSLQSEKLYLEFSIEQLKGHVSPSYATNARLSLTKPDRSNEFLQPPSLAHSFLYFVLCLWFHVLFGDQVKSGDGPRGAKDPTTLPSRRVTLSLDENTFRSLRSPTTNTYRLPVSLSEPWDTDTGANKDFDPRIRISKHPRMSEGGGGGRGGSPSAGGAGDWEARKAMNITSSDRFGKRPSSAPGKARKVNRHMVPVVPEYRPFQGPTISSSLHSLYGPVHLRNSSRMRVKRGKTKQLTSKQSLSSPLSAEDLDVDKYAPTPRQTTVPPSHSSQTNPLDF